jgi:hypothetical protein
MSEEPAGPDETSRLQFDRAEYTQPDASLVCAACRSSVHGVYFDVNGATLCERCRHDLTLAEAGAGGGASRLGRALALGLGATVAASLAWFAIRKLTGYEFGILAIGVGLLVGGAVRKGARGRGGWRYQALAMFLTYNAIVVTYIPEIVAGLRSANHSENATAAASPAPAAVPSGAGAAAASPAPATPAPPASEVPAVVGVAVALAFLLALAYAAPFLVVFQDPSALMGLVIIAIALYEAWKLNRRVALQISGPYQVGSAPAPASDERA